MPIPSTVCSSLLLAATVWVPVCNASAQEYFGKNKVNYSTYHWRYVKTKHFTIYFPLATMILLSIVLTVIINVFFRR